MAIRVSEMAVGIPSLSNKHGLFLLAEDLFLQHSLAAKLFLVANGPAVTGEILRLHRYGATVHDPGENIGVAASWNWIARKAFAQGFKEVLILNDDLELLHRGVLYEFWRISRSESPYSVLTDGPNGWHAFLLPKWVYERVGPFDEGFWPGYCEDWDYSRRLHLAGIAEIPLIPLTRHRGAESQKADPEIDLLLARSKHLVHQRYREKWGGERGQERFSIPWEGRDPSPSTKIALSGVSGRYSTLRNAPTHGDPGAGPSENPSGLLK